MDVIKDVCNLILFFFIFFQDDNYCIKLVSYVVNLLGYEGFGSLFDVFKWVGLVEFLFVGFGMDIGVSVMLDISMFFIFEGLCWYDDILLLVFSYIDRIWVEGIS